MFHGNRLKKNNNYYLLNYQILANFLGKSNKNMRNESALKKMDKEIKKPKKAGAT